MTAKMRLVARVIDSGICRAVNPPPCNAGEGGRRTVELMQHGQGGRARSRRATERPPPARVIGVTAAALSSGRARRSSSAEAASRAASTRSARCAALDLLSVNRTVNQFDVYVGTSAGSFVASAVANGVTPEEMMQVIVERDRRSVPRCDRRLAAAPQLRRDSRQGGAVPAGELAQLARTLARDPGQLTGGRPRRRARRAGCRPVCTPALASRGTSAASSPTGRAHE